MANKEVSEESVLLKTNTSIEKLPDGTCIKRITQTKDGKTEVKEEKLDCDQALQDVREKDEEHTSKGNDSFDERMRDKLNEMKKSFSKEENKAMVNTNEESYSDGTNKMVKVTRESNSIEETKKTEKIPDGTKRILKITRESFLEETKKSVGPMETEEEPEAVKLLDESFAEESKENSPVEKKDSAEEAKTPEAGKTESEGKVMSVAGDASKKSEEEEEDDDDDNEDEIDNKELEEDKNEKFYLADGTIAEDGFIKKMMTAIFKILFWPLFKLGVL